jgi:serine/threonine-protein kinase
MAPDASRNVPPEARVGTLLRGKWHVDRLIDVGGMGAVFAATHRNGRRAAIKVLHGRFARDPMVRDRFLREGYVANKIDHPGAVAILDDEIAEDGAPYLVMELLEGESLAAWLARAGGRLPPIEVLAVTGQLLEVLEVAHAAGVVHRDIKPANVFATVSGHIKLLDFGLARVHDGSSRAATASGIVMGTIGYLAPEQARGRPDLVDARTDVFAVGAVVFRALSGRRIHEKGSNEDNLLAAMKEQAPPLAEVLGGVGPALGVAVDRALAFERERRWPSARAMFDALRMAYDETKARAAPPLPMPASTAGAGLHIEVEEPSLVVDVMFGPDHEESVAMERQRVGEASRAVDGKPGRSGS